MNTRTNPQTGEPLGQFQYTCLHIPSGVSVDSWAEFPRERSDREADALRLLEKWSWQQPGVWLYRLVP